MLSIERTRELMPKETAGLSDEEVTDIRDTAYMLAEVAFDHWMAKRKKARQTAAEKLNQAKNQPRASL